MRASTQRKVIIILAACGIALFVFLFLRNLNNALLYTVHHNSISQVILITSNGRYVYFKVYSGKRIPGTNERPEGLYRYDNKKLILEKRQSSALMDNITEAVSNDGRFIILRNTDASSWILYDWLRQTSRALTRKQIGQLYLTDGKWSTYGNQQMSNNLRFQVTEEHISRIFVVDHQDNSRSYISTGINPIISGDGSTVAFLNYRSQVMLYYRPKKQLMCASKSRNRYSNKPCSLDITITPDGRYLCFISQATNLTRHDTPYASDVFMFDRERQKLRCVSYTQQ